MTFFGCLEAPEIRHRKIPTWLAVFADIQIPIRDFDLAFAPRCEKLHVSAVPSAFLLSSQFCVVVFVGLAPHRYKQVVFYAFELGRIVQRCLRVGAAAHEACSFCVTAARG